MISRTPSDNSLLHMHSMPAPFGRRVGGFASIVPVICRATLHADCVICLAVDVRSSSITADFRRAPVRENLLKGKEPSSTSSVMAKMRRCRAATSSGTNTPMNTAARSAMHCAANGAHSRICVPASPRPIELPCCCAYNRNRAALRQRIAT